VNYLFGMTWFAAMETHGRREVFSMTKVHLMTSLYGAMSDGRFL